MKYLIVFMLFLCWIEEASALKRYHERYYQTILCKNLHGVMEYRLSDRTRVDCLSDNYAIEVDFAKKWAESIGQSLYYAKMTGKKPAVGLIMNRGKDSRYLKRLELIAKEYNIKIFIIWTK
ncbi:hypothetical protein [Sulfurimonas sp.]